MPLRVGVDAWNLPHDRRGIGRYVREIVNAWIGFGPATVQVELIIPERNAWLARPRYVRELAAALPVRSRGRERGLDVVWFPWNGMSWEPLVPAVATLHDASLFRIPPDDPAVAAREHHPFLTAAARARRVLTDSEFSKEELLRFLSVGPERIEVIPLGISEVFFKDAVEHARERFVLVVGDVEARKGLATVIEALEQLPQLPHGPIEVRVVGSGTADVPQASKSNVRVSRLGWVSDEELADLYRTALTLVYPSEYEGYGLPIIEAMACGTPAIAAYTASSREAGGAAAIYFPPGDVGALANAIGGLAEAPKADVDLIVAAGRAHARGRTWEETARKTLMALMEGA